MRILVATDGSETASAAVRFAAALAVRCRKSSLAVITVGTLPTRLWRRRARAGRLETSIEERERVWSEKVLERGRRDAKRLGARVRGGYVGTNGSEPFAETIARAAGREKAALIG